ncbi:MAG: M20/M25/M40 family metallo-hydrolase [Rhizobiales bacterium]|nr:M20/M25/M40 family metallo-hydrolase [Hyphomicrobiales bacterium]
MEQLQHALALARDQYARSIDTLRMLVRARSLTGEEGGAQRMVANLVRVLGADVTTAEPDVGALFEAFPTVAQYPTHWEHDLILPYMDLPTHQALQDSGLQTVLNYDGRPNVIGFWKGTGGGRSLVLNAHIDTVTIEPAAQWTRDPFGGEVVDGVMYGRGTSDMKGGLTAALMAMTYLHEAGVKLRGDVVFQSVVNEEHAGNGTLDAVRRGFVADAAIVLEPTNNTIMISHPGGLYWQVTLTGTQRSPGARWKGAEQDGVSAIELLSPVVEALLSVERSYNQDRTSGANEPAPFSMVMGKIAGGHYETVTAGEVVLKGGAYFAPDVGDVVAVMERFRAAIAEANARHPLLRRYPAKLEFLHHDDSTSQSHDITIAQRMSAVLAHRGGESGIHAGTFCCDMRHLVNQGNIPSIIFGPGTIAQAHKPDEHIVLAEYLACIEHLIAFIAHWCNEDTDRAPSNATIRRHASTHT